MVYVGIDPGVKTGFAFIGDGLKDTITLSIHNAFTNVEQLLHAGHEVHVRVEDARKRKWFGDRSDEKQQGAGSIKRDCKIWEDFLTELSLKTALTFEMLHPIKGGTKINKNLFKQISGISHVTSEHARDAYFLIHNYKKSCGRAVGSSLGS